MIYKKYDINLREKEGVDEKQQASVTFYLLDTPESMTLIKERPLVIVCPGGGYEYKSQRESEPVVMKFLAAGFHCALMNYSCAPAKWPAAARELAHAVVIARENAADWHVKADAIFVNGYSAGGHLAACLSTIWNDPVFYQEFDEAIPENTEEDRPVWRPDGAILAYPVITMLEKTHAGSRDNLLGKDAGPELLESKSLEKRVTKATVPAFIWATKEDGSVPVENSMSYACALQRENIPFELHIFEKGGHGLSLANLLTATGTGHLIPADEVWTDMAITWLKGRVGKLSPLE